jgi:hypothetical protein
MQDFSTLRITKPNPSGPLLEALGAHVYSDDTGTANAYAITVSPSPTLVIGTVVAFKAANSNSGVSTLTINGGAPITIKKYSSGSLVDLTSGDITTGQLITTTFDGVYLQMQSGAGGGGGGSGNATEIQSIPVNPAPPTHNGELLIYDSQSNSYIPGDPLVQGVFPPGTYAATANPGSPPSPIKPVLIGGVGSSSGDLLSLSADDTTGGLLIKPVAGSAISVGQVTSPWVTEDAADSTVGSTVGTTAITVGGSDGTDLRILAVDQYGRAKTPALSTLNDLVSSVRRNQIEINFSLPFDSNLITNTFVSSGTFVQANGCATYSTGVSANGEATGISVQQLEYRPGHEWYCYFTASFTAGSASSYQRIGPYSTTDGFYLSYEGATVNVTQRQNSSDTHTAQSSWNGDPANGSAGSKFTGGGSPVALNFQKINIYRFHGAWFGAAPVLFDVFSPDGTWITLHTFRFPNTLTTPYAYSTNWNITVDVANTGNTSNLSVVTACWAMGACDADTKLTDTLTDYTLAETVRAVIAGKTPSGAYGNVSLSAQDALSVAGSGTSTVNAAAWDDATSVNSVVNILSDNYNDNTATVSVLGTNSFATGAITFEASIDGANFVGILGINAATGLALSSAIYTIQTGLVVFLFNVTGFNYFRARLSTGITGTGSPPVNPTVAVSWLIQGLASPSVNATITTTTGPITINDNQGTPNTQNNAWPFYISDTSHGPAAVKAGSTAAVATDTALVVAISPNNSPTVVQPGSSTSSALPGSNPFIITGVSSQILAANPNRKEVLVVNTGVVPVYLGLGQTPSTLAYHVPLSACIVANDGTGGVYASDLWTGTINAICAATGSPPVDGSLCVTELT